MTTLRNRMALAAALSVSAVILWSPASAQSNEAMLEELREQLAETRRELSEMQQQLGELKSNERVSRSNSRSVTTTNSQNRPRPPRAVIAPNAPQAPPAVRTRKGNSLFVSRAPRPMIGVVLHNRVRDKGVKLAAVTPDAPADKAGLKAGDELISLNDRDLTGSRAAALAYKMLDDMEEGDEYTFVYRRDGEEKTAIVTAEIIEPATTFSFNESDQANGIFSGNPMRFDLFSDGMRMDLDQLKDWAESRRDTSVRLNDGRWRNLTGPWMGGENGPVVWNLALGWASLQMAQLNPSLAEYFGVEEGVLIIDSALENADLKGGDVITEIDGEPVTSPGDAMRVLTRFSDDESVNFSLMRHGEALMVTIDTPSAAPGDFSFGYHYSSREDQ
ncbi:MAG: PDZ domain-containing protein [Lysobacterales bacterium]